LRSYTLCHPFHVVAELPILHPVSDVITLHLVHLMHPVAELRECLAETAESVHSIFHIAFLLTNRYAPLIRHSYSSLRKGRYGTIDKSRKIQLLDPEKFNYNTFEENRKICANGKARYTRKNLQIYIYIYIYIYLFIYLKSYNFRIKYIQINYYLHEWEKRYSN